GSVFLSRPGTRASCRVSTSSTAKPCASRISCGAIQYTPVLSIATDSTCRTFSHSAMRINSGVVPPKSAISRPLPSAVGAHTQWLPLPKSIPATFVRTIGKPCNCPLVLDSLIFLHHLTFLSTPAQVGQILESGLAARGSSQCCHQ